MVVDELQNNLDEQLPHVEFAYNNSVSAVTGLAPNEVHIGRLPRLPLMIFERTGVAGHQSLARDHLAYCDLSSVRQQTAYDIVREHHALTISRVERRNSSLSDALRVVPKFAVGGWVWVYNTAVTIRRGTKTDTDTTVFKAKLWLNWTGPYKDLRVGPCTPADSPDGSPRGAKILHLDLPSDMPGADGRRRVSVQRYKPCASPHDHGDMPKYLPAGLTQYVLNKLSKKSPPYHVTQDDVSTLFKDSKWRRSPDPNRFAVEVGPSWCCTRRTGRVSLDRPGSGKWTSSSSATSYCNAGPALRISTAKLTACTAGCELVLHNGNFLGATASDSWRPITAAFSRRTA